MQQRAPYAGHADLIAKSRLCIDQGASGRERPQLNTPLAVARFVRHLADADQEQLVVLSLDAKSRVVSIFEAALGGTRSVATGMQHVVKVPVIQGAFKVVLVHNHPSGDPSPSKSDRRFYRRAGAALTLLGPRLVDSVVVGRGGFASLRWGTQSSWRGAAGQLVERYPIDERRANGDGYIVSIEWPDESVRTGVGRVEFATAPDMKAALAAMLDPWSTLTGAKLHRGQAVTVRENAPGYRVVAFGLPHGGNGKGRHVERAVEGKVPTKAFLRAMFSNQGTLKTFVAHPDDWWKNLPVEAMDHVLEALDLPPDLWLPFLADVGELKAQMYAKDDPKLHAIAAPNVAVMRAWMRGEASAQDLAEAALKVSEHFPRGMIWGPLQYAAGVAQGKRPKRPYVIPAIDTGPVLALMRKHFTVDDVLWAMWLMQARGLPKSGG